jgi:hypothetical protein
MPDVVVGAGIFAVVEYAGETGTSRTASGPP